MLAEPTQNQQAMSKRDAYFSLIAIKMMKLSDKYKRKLEDLHDLFYTVSCDFTRLEKVLQQEDCL